MSLQEEFERQLVLEGCYNVRDIGGYTTEDGRKTRWRTILRADNINRLSASAQQCLLEEMGVRTVIDLRDGEEVAKVPPVFSQLETVKYINVPLYGEAGSEILKQSHNLFEVYSRVLATCQNKVKTVIETVAEADPSPVVVHCAVGKDRTGITMALLLGAANVPTETIADDYAISETNLASVHAKMLEGGQRAGYDMEIYVRFLEARRETMLETLAYVQENFGGVPEYLQSIGLSAAQLERLRARLVD